MNIEEKANKKIEEFKKMMSSAVNDVLDSAYLEILPHVENDTLLNVSQRSQSVVENIVKGNFRKSKQQNVILVKDDNFIDVAIKITDGEYDLMRRNLIEAMPACPKDLEISSLRNQIQSLYDQINRGRF